MERSQQTVFDMQYLGQCSSTCGASEISSGQLKIANFKPLFQLFLLHSNKSAYFVLWKQGKGQREKS